MSEPTIFELGYRMRDIIRRRPSPKKRRQNEHLREIAVEIGEVAPGIEYWIVENPMKEEYNRMDEALSFAATILPTFRDEDTPELRQIMEEFSEAAARKETMLRSSMEYLKGVSEAFNGYVAFPKRHTPLQANASDTGILEYIPVHGGVTYINKDQTASVYGFDTEHYNSEHVPRSDKQWIAWQCRVLYEGLMKASKIERRYLHASSEQAKARILQPLVDMIPEEEISTGALLRMLSGKL